MREINQKRLKYFREVLVHGSIRGAADALNTAPSVITRQVALLEEELGLVLFERQARGVVATDAALHVLDYWKSCQAHQEQLSDRLRAIESMDAGSVRIVASEGFLGGLLDQVVAPFCAAHPKLDVAVDALPVSALVGEVVDDTAHMGIAYHPPSDPQLQIVASAAAPAKLLVRAGHPLARLGAPLQLRQILAYPLALMPPGYGVGRLVELLEYAEHLKLHPAFRSNSVMGLKRFVRSTDGVTFVGAGLAAAPEIEAGELVALDIAHPLCKSAQVRLIVRQGRPLSVAAGHLLAQIRTRFSVFGGAPAAAAGATGSASGRRRRASSGR
ncbi:MAG: LysR substrate-binding domain-containing protein [Variovorax sp.]